MEEDYKVKVMDNFIALLAGIGILFLILGIGLGVAIESADNNNEYEKLIEVKKELNEITVERDTYKNLILENKRCNYEQRRIN